MSQDCTVSPIAPQRPCFGPGSESNVAVGINGLPAGVLLVGTPLVEEVGSSDLTITQEAVNGSDKVIFGVTYITGTAVLFHRAGGQAGRQYTLKLTVATSAIPADQVVGYLRFTISRDPARGIAA